MPNSVCSAMKIIPEMSSDHCTLGGNFSEEAKLRSADLESGALRIG